MPIAAVLVARKCVMRMGGISLMARSIIGWAAGRWVAKRGMAKARNTQSPETPARLLLSRKHLKALNHENDNGEANE